MTVVRGLREALVLLLIAVALVAAVVGIWVAVDGGDFVHRIGVALAAVGALVGVTGDLTLSKLETMPARTVFGLPPEQEGAGGARVLTGIGIFLFVGLPLMALGIALVG